VALAFHVQAETPHSISNTPVCVSIPRPVAAVGREHGVLLLCLRRRRGGGWLLLWLLLRVSDRRQRYLFTPRAMFDIFGGNMKVSALAAAIGALSSGPKLAANLGGALGARGGLHNGLASP